MRMPAAARRREKYAVQDDLIDLAVFVMQHDRREVVAHTQILNTLNAELPEPVVESFRRPQRRRQQRAAPALTLS